MRSYGCSGFKPCLECDSIMGAEPTDLVAGRPKKLKYREVFKWSRFRDSIGTFFYLVRLVFSTYDSKPAAPTNFNSSNPAGSITEQQLPICQSIYDEVNARNAALEAKANSMVAVIAILTPLIVSAVVYIQSIKSSTNGFLVLTLVSLLFLLVALLAAYRTLRVTSHQQMYLDSIIDMKTKEIREFSPNRHGRGLLWCATMNTEAYNLKTDFVRASQIFILISLLLVFCASALLMFSPTPNQIVQPSDARNREIAASSSDIAGELKSINTNLSMTAEKLRETNQILSEKAIGKKRIQPTAGRSRGRAED